jgi:hypothetical protein
MGGLQDYQAACMQCQVVLHVILECSPTCGLDVAGQRGGGHACSFTLPHDMQLLPLLSVVDHEAGLYYRVFSHTPDSS